MLWYSYNKNDSTHWKREMKTKKYTLIELIVVLIFGMVLCFIIAFVCGAIFIGCKSYKEVKENGAKQTIEKVWEGPKKP